MSEQKKPIVQPLRAVTMTLKELQIRTLKFCDQVRSQLHRGPYDEGLSDREFLDEIVDDLRSQIQCDMDVIEIHKKRARQQ